MEERISRIRPIGHVIPAKAGGIHRDTAVRLLHPAAQMPQNRRRKPPHRTKRGQLVISLAPSASSGSGQNRQGAVFRPVRPSPLR